MDKSNRSLNTNKNSPALVPFQGIGTRLRRSRSKDHSSEKDNLAIAGGEFEIANLKRLNHHHNQSQTSHYNGFNESINNFYSAGTLERPKRFFTANHHQNQINTQFYHYPSSTNNHSSFVGHSTAVGGNVGTELTRNNGRNNGASSSLALYEESRILSHQYEEPQYLIDNNYRTLTNNNRLDSFGKTFGSFQNKRTNELLDYGSLLNNNNNNNNNNGNNSINQTTTIIPPSKLFAKTLSTYKQSYDQASSYETYASKLSSTNGRMHDKTDGAAPSTTIINDNNELNDAENKQSKSNKERNILNDCTALLSHRRQELDLVKDHQNGDNGNDIVANNNDNAEQRDNEEENNNENDENDDEPTVSLVGEELLSSSAAIGNLSGARLQLRSINSGSPMRPLQQHHLTSQTAIPTQPYNSIMHTYSNPFQNCNISSYSEDTTGPIIPNDLNTMRPSQLLKNSFAGSGPPPSLQSNSERNLVTYLTERLLSYLRAERKTAPEMNEHRCCSWLRSVSTLTLLILIFILIIIIILITAMNKDKLSSEQQKNHYSLYTKHSDGTRVPCVVVEDLESSSTSQHLSSQFGGDSADNQQMPEHLFPFDSTLNGNCPTYFPRDSSQYKEINLAADPTFGSLSTDSSTTMPISLQLTPFSSWSIWFNQLMPMYINFQFYTPISTRLALVVNKNEPPTLTSHRLFQIISEDNLPVQWNNAASINGRSTRDSSLILMQFKHLFDQGSWYLTLVNDMDINVPIVVNITAITNQTIHCPANCHNHGYCHLGKCQCFPGFIGHDCADNVCPVFCGGHGQYLQGSCQCEAGWKGRECTVQLNECEISDCNGNGNCIQGICHCQTGFKGEYCDQVDCIDPECSGHGVCLDGNCFCKPGFVGTNCSLVDSKLHKFFPNCSGHGVYDYEHDQCLCHLHYTGPDCSQLSCSLNCGQHGSCKDGRCFCDDGWSGSNCQYRICDPRCLEHGKCHNGTCHCQNGWMGKHCTLNGCTNSCSNHGQCVSYQSATSNELDYNFDTTGVLWKCQCDNGWNGHDCSAPQETNCNDEIDNDNDGLIDCADSECCLHEQCGHQSLMCITSPDPLDILLRKQPLPPTSSFFQKVLFLIEDGSVQSYAQKDVYSARRASIIRGQVVSKELNGLIGIRVSVVNDQKYGFTLTRSDGWFDILVNGGGIITLQFQRNPFYPIKKSILVPWNDITVIQNPIVMLLGPSALNENGNDFQNFLLNINNNNNDQASSNFYHLFSISDFGDSNWLKWASLRVDSESASSNNDDYLYNSCDEHDFEQIKPIILDHTFQSSSLFITPHSESICDNLDSCIIAETQIVQEKLPIGNTKLNLVHQSSQAQGYSSTLTIQLTPSSISKSLHFILLRILIEGNVHEKIFEADPDLRYTFQWNKRNVYRQKVYGFSIAKVYVGYYYQNCPQIMWTGFSAKIRGYDMEISEIGQWNLEIHNRFNPHEGIFQRGDGQFINFKNNEQFPLIIEPLAGIDGQARSFACTNLDECNTNLISARFLTLVALASAPDGSIFVGDSNLIRLLTPEGIIYTVYKFRSNRTNRQNYEYHIAFNSMDQYLYISDPDRFQIVRIPMLDKFENTQEIPMVEPEIVVGTGEQCFPNDRFACGDGKIGTEVQLIYPKDLAFGLDGSLFFADGNVIRMLNTAGYVRLMAGQYSKRQWKPISCEQSHEFNNIKLKWPTSLAVHPINGALYFVDNNVLFKLNQNMKISIIHGYPSFCLEDSSNQNNTEIDCNDFNRWNSQTLALCGDELLFGSIAFAPNGVLYLTDISRHNENRIFALFGDTMQHVAGYKSKISVQQQKCPVEKCIDMAGHNCTCLISQYESDDNTLDSKISLNIRFQSISAITVNGDGTVYISDEGKLQIYALKSYIPQMDDQQEIKILIPNAEEMYVFNKYGQHVRTRSITTGRTLYTFIYNQENSFGKLTEVIDSAGHKIMFIRDQKSGSIQTIESTTGLKCQITINNEGLLESFNNDRNRSYYFDYFGNGLIRSRYETFTGRTNIYQYNSNGRIKYFIRPNGDLIDLNLQDNNKNGIILTEMPLFSPNIDSSIHHYHQPQNRRHVYMINSNNSVIKFQNDVFDGQQQFELYSLMDGTLRLNVPGVNIDFYLRPKISKLSLDLLAIQAQLFPFISKFFLIPQPQQANQLDAQIKNGYQSSQIQQALNLEIDYNLKLKSSFIDSVEKLITINNTASTLLKIEYDWNANREIYYNQTQRPILFIQYDDYGRPIQWIPNIKEHWPANSITYDKFGQLDTWQDGQQTLSYQRDRVGRIAELRQTSTENTVTKIRYTYSSNMIDGDVGQHEFNSINNNINPSFTVPTMVTLKSGHRYGFDLDNAGHIQSIILPKGARHNFSIILTLGSYKFAYCAPIATDLINTAGSNIHISPSSHCYLIYFDQNWQPLMSVLPYDTGKIINHYRSTYSMVANDYGQRSNIVDENIIIDRIIHGNGLVERWLNRKTNQVVKGVWRDGTIEFINQYKYQRSTFLLKHQSYQYGKIYSITPLTYNYRYDNLLRLRSIQPKLGAINLANLDFSYDSHGRIETIGNYRYFEHTSNETLLGDGISLLVRRYDPIRKLIRHYSLTVSDKKVFRADYVYDSQGLLVQIRTFMHHLGNNKVGLQNFTYDPDGQLIEMQGREHWRFIYDANGNLITFLYMGNRVDIEYDHGDRIKKFGKNQNNLPVVGGSTPYLTDLRGFVVQRGNEFLSYNNLGQLIKAITPNRYEVNYIYDYLGRLVLRRDHQKNVTQYFYGNPNKPYLVTHLYNNADGRMMTMIYDDIDDLLIMIRLNNENFYVVCDQNGSPMLVFDHRAQVIKEIHRSPYGHVLFDSNPGIYIPVDFHGGIPDPLTNLVYFSKKHEQRFYDSLIGRWLVPKIDGLFHESLLKNPRYIHLYQFMQNDPINIHGRKYDGADDDNNLNGIYSVEQISETLARQTSELVNQDLMESTSAQMLHYLKKLTPMLEKYAKSYPLKSLYINYLRTIFRNVQQYSNFQAKTYYSKFITNDWTSALNILPMISWKEGLFAGGIVLTCMPNAEDNIIQVHFAHNTIPSAKTTMSIDPLYRESLMVLINGSHLLDVHLVMAGQDYYYFVKNVNDSSILEKTTGSLIAKFKQYQTRLNMTVQEVRLNDSGKKTIIEVKIYHPAAIFNIRFGCSIEMERERILRLARKYAILQRLNHERLNLLREIFTNWNEKEQQFIIKSKELPNVFGKSSPFSFDYYHSMEELAEDPNNIMVMSRSRR